MNTLNKKKTIENRQKPNQQMAIIKIPHHGKSITKKKKINYQK